MHLRKVLDFKGCLGVTLPKDLTNALAINAKDYVEVHLRDRRTIVIKTHRVEPKKITIHDYV